MKKTIITVVGKDTVGIIAKVCTYLADNQCEYPGYLTDYRGWLLQHDDDHRCQCMLRKQPVRSQKNSNTLGEEIGVNDHVVSMRISLTRCIVSETGAGGQKND